MSFETNYRIVAVPAQAADALFDQLLDDHGEYLHDGNSLVKTVVAHWDDTEHTRLRAANYPKTITGVPLKDGRLAFKCMWQSDVLAEICAGEINGVTELSESQYLAAIKPLED